MVGWLVDGLVGCVVHLFEALHCVSRRKCILVLGRAVGVGVGSVLGKVEGVGSILTKLGDLWCCIFSPSIFPFVGSAMVGC